MNIKQKPNTQTIFDKQIFNIISSASSYNSGADFLSIKEDNQNIVLFGSSRSKIYN